MPGSQPVKPEARSHAADRATASSSGDGRLGPGPIGAVGFGMLTVLRGLRSSASSSR